MLLELALGLFLAGAAGGLFMAMRILAKKNVPNLVAVLHGLAAVFGLLLLLFAVMAARHFGGAGIALIVLVGAASGGFLLLSFHIRERPWPVPLVLVHGLAAVTGVVVLLLTILDVFE